MGAAGGDIRKKENEGGNEMNHKVGDTVRIQSREWMTREYDVERMIGLGARYAINDKMKNFAGMTAKVTDVCDDYYWLDVDNGGCRWEDWMFDPDFRHDGPLSPEDAIRAMLDGETLYAKDGTRHWFNGDQFMKAYVLDDNERCVSEFASLYRRPERRKRPMTGKEALAWSESDESLGWMVKDCKSPWTFPRYFGYSVTIAGYIRARLLPDGSGIDETTICEFEVEE
jgi:hypothetical protein